MANLMSIGSDNNWSLGQLPRHRGEVGNLLVECRALKEDTEENYSFLQNLIDPLEDLYNMVYSEEQRLYSILNVQDIKGLQKKVDEVSKDSLLAAMLNDGNEIFETIVDLTSEAAVVDFTNTVHAFVDDKETRSVFKRVYGQKFKDETVISIGKLLNLVGKQIEVTTNVSANAGTKDGVAIRGIDSLVGQATLKNVKGNGKFEIEFKFSDDLSKLNNNWKKWQKRLEDDFKLKFDLTNQLDVIKKVLSKYVDNELIGKCVFLQLDSLSSRYDLKSNPASVKGFLGEVRANAIINYIYGNHVSIATGNIKNLKGQEIPIDLIFKDIGFQIKNYKEVDGKVSFGNFMSYKEEKGMSMENFIDRRLQAPEIGLLLKTLYASFQYNQEVEDAVNFSGIRSTLDYYATERAPKIFESFADKILKVSEEFEARANEQNLFQHKDLYFNTFFVVGNNFIPSSAILRSLINQIESKMYGGDDSALKSSFWIIPDSPSEPPAWSFGPEKENLFNQALSKIKIKYQITFDIQEILSNAI